MNRDQFIETLSNVRMAEDILDDVVRIIRNTQAENPSPFLPEAMENLIDKKIPKLLSFVEEIKKILVASVNN